MLSRRVRLLLKSLPKPVVPGLIASVTQNKQVGLSISNFH